MKTKIQVARRPNVYIEAELQMMIPAIRVATGVPETTEHEPIRVPVLEFTFGIGGSGWWGRDLPEWVQIEEWAPGWNRERLDTALALGRRWHLNQLRAACAHQTIRQEPAQYGLTRCLTRPTADPCASGYRYGEAWLTELIPPAVADELRATFMLPAESTP